MDKNSQIDLPEIFLSNSFDKDKLYYLQQQAKIRRIAPRLYTSNMQDSIDAIVRRNLWAIVALFYPAAIISERTAIEMKVASDGSIFVISDKVRPTSIGNITIRPKSGAKPQPADTPFMDDLFMASPARLVLENATPSRATKGGVSRTLSRKELEEYLDRVIRDKGEAAINHLRDTMRELAPKIALDNEFELVNRLISALLQTHDEKLESQAGIARNQGLPFDSRRTELFSKLYRELESSAPIIRYGKFSETLAFFDAYFSNFIEGTEFEVQEAQNIVFNNIIPQNRPTDAHDILGTYNIVSNLKEMSQVPKNFDEFVELLKHKHRILMAGRIEKEPGIFKVKGNRAGSTSFVAPDLVLGTLKQGFEVYRKLSIPFSKAVFMMFLISEVHPFNDGNGRVGRIMMNAELVAKGEQRLIIPTVYRNNYISALKALSHNGITNPIIRTLDFAQKYTANIDWSSYDTALGMLQMTNAFIDPNEADEMGTRLVLP